jgi:hypothetical protein
MTQDEMYEKSFERPRDYFKLSAAAQWEIDKRLGILDWEVENLTDAQKQRMFVYYWGDGDSSQSLSSPE